MKLFAQLTKVDEEKRLVYGVAAAEAPDRSGEVLDYATSKAHFESWVKETLEASDGQSHGNLRAMHGKVAAGKLIGMEFDDANKMFPVVAKVVDDNEWKKVTEGVYTGFSIGGSYVKKWEDPSMKKADGKPVTRYTAAPNELSLVDRPCIKQAKFFDVQKMDGTVVQVEFQAPAEGDLEKNASAEDDGSSSADGASQRAADPAQSAEAPAAKADATEYEVEGSDDEVSKLATVMHDEKLAMKDVLEAVASLVAVRKADAETKAELAKEEAGDLAKGTTVAKEVQKAIVMLAGTDFTGFGEAVAKALTAGATLMVDAMDDEVFKLESGNDLEKIGARNSSKDKSRIQQVHDIACELGCECGPAKSDTANDLSKAAPADLQKMVLDALAPLQKVIDAQQDRITKLEAQPAAPRAILKAISKSDDALPGSKAPEVSPVVKGGQVDEAATDIKKIHQSGGVALGWTPGGGPMFNNR